MSHSTYTSFQMGVDENEKKNTERQRNKYAKLPAIREL